MFRMKGDQVGGKKSPEDTEWKAQICRKNNLKLWNCAINRQFSFIQMNYAHHPHSKVNGEQIDVCACAIYKNAESNY